jgi:hypothetical protein
MSNVTLFSRPQKLIDRAKGTLSALEEITTAFFHLDNFELRIETDRETGWKSKKLRLAIPIPDAIEEHTTNSLNNLRNAFDQMLFAACVGVGKPRLKGYYPWAQNPTDLERRFVNKKTGEETVPNELWDLVRSQEPYNAGEGYEGGNTYLRSIATLTNNKHTVGIQIGGSVT